MENTLDFSKLFNMLKKHWKFIVLLPLVFLVVSLLLTFFVMKPKYESSTQVLINQSSKNKELMAQEVQSNIQLVNTYAEIVKTPRILDKVAKKDKKHSASEIKGMLTINTQSESQVLNLNVETENKGESEKIANEIASVVKNEMPKIMKVDNVSILSSANGTASKVSPKPLTNALIGLILGLLIAFIILIVKEVLDKRIRTEEDIENELGIPVLGSVLKIK